jgi:hypothetical protein
MWWLPAKNRQDKGNALKKEKKRKKAQQRYLLGGTTETRRVTIPQIIFYTIEGPLGPGATKRPRRSLVAECVAARERWPRLLSLSA